MNWFYSLGYSGYELSFGERKMLDRATTLVDQLLEYTK